MKKLLLSLTLVAVLGLTACSNKANNAQRTGSAEQLEEIHTAVQDAYGDMYGANQTFDAATLESVYGISEDMYDAVIAEGPMMSAQVDTFIGVLPKEGKEKDVMDALNAYRDVQINEALQYPMNLPKINASEVTQIGDYVFFLMLGYTDEMYDTEEEELKAFQDLNQIAVKAINEVVVK